MPGCRGVPQTRTDGGRHGAQVALLSEHLTEGVGDVHDVDIGGVDPRFRQGLVHQLAGQIGEITAFPGQVAGEIALISA